MRAALVVIWVSGVTLSALAAATDTLGPSLQADRTNRTTVAYRARLTPVPIDLTMQASVTGSGSVSAILTGAKLSVTGTFEGLKSAATIGKIHKGPVRGVRGPELFTLTVSSGTSGTISGTFDLTPVQITDLEKGRLYVQIHSDKAPDGNLWGWLLPLENRR